jgi:hypothetical protein
MSTSDKKEREPSCSNHFLLPSSLFTKAFSRPTFSYHRELTVPSTPNLHPFYYLD